MRSGRRLWDAGHGICEYDAIPENAAFDLFRFLAVCWLRLEIERLAAEIARPRWLVQADSGR